MTLSVQRSARRRIGIGQKKQGEMPAAVETACPRPPLGVPARSFSLFSDFPFPVSPLKFPVPGVGIVPGRPTWRAIFDKSKAPILQIPCIFPCSAGNCCGDWFANHCGVSQPVRTSLRDFCVCENRRHSMRSLRLHAQLSSELRRYLGISAVDSRDGARQPPLSFDHLTCISSEAVVLAAFQKSEAHRRRKVE